MVVYKYTNIHTNAVRTHALHACDVMTKVHKSYVIVTGPVTFGSKTKPIDKRFECAQKITKYATRRFDFCFFGIKITLTT